MPEELESKITDEHRAQVGRKAPPRKFIITTAEAARMRAVLQDADPRYAPGTGVAPPYCLALLDPARTGLGVRVLPAGILTAHEWNFMRPLPIDEELQAVAQVTDLRDRLGGRYGYSVLSTTRVDFFDSLGNLLATSTAVGTQFDPNARREE
ncbi:MAG: hypothetical protein ACKVT1_17985 [Dehalococcoidia bacterium]